MSYTDEEKLSIVRDKFIDKIMSIELWDDLKGFINIVSKAKVKNFVKNALQEQADSEGSHITLFAKKKADTLTLKNDVDSL